MRLTLAALAALLGSAAHVAAECATGYAQVSVPLCQPTGPANVNDTDSSIIYSLSNVAGAAWNTNMNNSYFGGTARDSNTCVNPPQVATTVQGPMAAINFVGTSISLIGQTGPTFGKYAYAIDGGALNVGDAYSASNTYQQPLFIVSGLSNAAHVLSYQVTCNKNASATDFHQVVDAYQVIGSSNPISNATRGSFADGNVTISGSGWTCGVGNSSDLSNGHCWDGVFNDSMSFTFTGSLIEVFMRPDTGDGLFDVQIDGSTVATNIDTHYTYNGGDNDQLTAWMAFARSGLGPGSHTIKIIVDGAEDSYGGQESNGVKNLIQIDAFYAFP